MTESRHRRSKIARRGVLAAGAAGLSGAVLAGVRLRGGGTAGAGAPDGASDDVPAVGGGLPLIAGIRDSTVSVVQFIAHPDDGLYFMNPDAEQEITAGHAVLTVCLTSGEADGRNYRPHDPRARFAVRDRPAFARARVNGLRRAHALMATGDETSPWDVKAVYPVPGWGAELHTLRAMPRIRLLFLALVEARAVAAWRPVSLKGLWQGAVPALPQLLPAHSPVPHAASRLTRGEIVACLAAVLRAYRPTVVRTLDPNPDHDPAHTGHKGYAPGHGPAYFDHQDHTHATYFVQQALASHWASHPTPRASVEHYVGYVNARLPWNLDAPAVRHKASLLDAYGWSDHRPCGDPSGCGDLKVGGGALRGKWVQSTRYRAPGAAAWAAPLADGRIAAFALLSGQAVLWYETGGGTWAGPVALPGAGLEGQIGVVAGKGGALRLFSVRTLLPDARGKGAHRREVVTAAQYGTAPGGRPLFSGWTGLGSCEPTPVASMETGYPEAAVAPDGTVYLAVRDAAGGVAVRVRTAAGRWAPWARLPRAAESGVRLLDGLGVAVDPAGRAHIFAPAQRGIAHWSAPGPGSPFALTGPAGLPGSAGPVTAVALPDGSLRLAYREPGTARVVLAELPAGDDTGRVVGLGDPDGGFGRVAVPATGPAPGPGSAPGGLLATRNGLGSVSVASALPAPGRWSPGSALHVHAAALVQDAQGDTVALAIGSDAELWTARYGAGVTDGTPARWAAAVRTAHATPARAAGAPVPKATGNPA
ncbi:PIG-L family deacetylase [Streptomyces sp. NBC_01190]|uniref:PIG-L family deacetylase n=1 Tax=Streptomyces sp. NBC_01190 TaxID=2903767 RepID=UPI00386F7E8A|nr:PIG-L family deacetylase [Streptomyces sp. NBC_01190]